MFRDANSGRRMLVGSIVVLTLSMSALVLVFAINLKRVVTTTEMGERLALNQQWGAMKGYLRIEKNTQTGDSMVLWSYDPDDPDQAWVVSRIKQRLLLADEHGQVLGQSFGTEGIGVDSPSQIKKWLSGALGSRAPDETFWTSRQDARGLVYLVRSGIVFDTRHHSPYYVAIAAPLTAHGDRIRACAWTFGGVIVCALLVGWSVARLAYQQS